MGGGYEQNCSFKSKTWIHRGGKVGMWIKPASCKELVEIANILYNNKCSFITVGHTSNIYFKNSFSIDYVLDTRSLKQFEEVDNNLIVCECGVPMKTLANYCVEHGYSGYEGMINLPGTVAGAIVNNSGCYECGVEKVLQSIDILIEDGTVINLKKEELCYSFRSSAIKSGQIKGVILRAYFDVSNHEEVNTLRQIAERNYKNRMITQDPPAMNLGSTVNIYGDYHGNVGFILKIIRRILKILRVGNEKSIDIQKKIMCVCYGHPSVAKYISSKRFSCFLWKDEGADMAYPLYLRMLTKLYPHVSVEIEIFD